MTEQRTPLQAAQQLAAAYTAWYRTPTAHRMQALQQARVAAGLAGALPADEPGIARHIRSELTALLAPLAAQADTTRAATQLARHLSLRMPQSP